MVRVVIENSSYTVVDRQVLILDEPSMLSLVSFIRFMMSALKTGTVGYQAKTEAWVFAQ